MAAGATAAGALVMAAALQAPRDDERPVRPVPDDHAHRIERGLVRFAERIAPLLEARCLRCHGGEATRAELDLSTREGLLAGGKSGEAVVPFEPAESRVLRLLRHEEKPAMPWKEAKLGEDEIAAIEEWIGLGAPYERALGAKEPGEAKREREVTDADRAFWSFRPLARPELPEVGLELAAWVRTDADRFIAAKLREHGLAPAAPAGRRALLRRAWFDVVGLPPPPDEVAAFLADEAPDAWERRIDALLSSPRFGERWARHWLDVARFAESHGFEHDYDRPHAWPYRDFVIDALNDDLPFDRFVQWQIAGDELAPDDPRAWFATGFLGAGVHATQITASQVEKERYDELDDVVATIGTAMLGLTIGCARCHDHKFDPLPARDYYRMVATFTRTVRSDFDVVLNAGEHAAALAAWGERHDAAVVRRERFERTEMERRLEAWLGARSTSGRESCAPPEPWIVPDEASLSSSGGAAFTRLADGSFLASGARAERDEYAFVARVPPGVAPAIASVRIEALADPSLVGGGPGRADNGNFGLTELRATWKGEGAAEAAALPLASARSTFDQAGLPAAAAIDGDERADAACWAVDPEFGKDHAAAFALATPLDAAAGGELSIRLLFRTNVFHSIGRLRVAIATRAEAPLRSGAIAASALRWLERFDRGELAADDEGAGKSELRAWFLGADPEWRERRRDEERLLAERPRPLTRKALVCSEGLPAIRLHTQGGDFLDATHFLERGDPGRKLEVVEPGWLQVLTRATGGEARWRSPPPAGARTPWDRRALAAWITDVEAGAGNLLARVAANRVWQHLYGRGIVATPSDFGATGAPPTHPELLEWLACELVERGWSAKSLLRELLASASYLQGGGEAEARAADPQNELFSRQPPRRLEAEAIRDALLAVSGLLDETMHGPGTLDVAAPRRSVYLFVKRSRLVPMLALFDAPNALSGVGRRQSTTVAPQSLFLMNALPVRAWAGALARRVEREVEAGALDSADAAFVRRAFELCYARPPAADELADSLRFLAEQAAALASAGCDPAEAAARARTDLGHALVSANEFVYVE